MIWLAWRQFRAQAVVVIGGLIALGVLMAVTGPHLVGLYRSTLANCHVEGNCQSALASFAGADHNLKHAFQFIVLVAPVLLGLFLGAPLIARDLEAGLHRLAWTQSVTRTRWLAVKFGVAGVFSVAAAGLLSIMVTWWSSPLDRANMSLFSTFDQRGIVPIGYAAFAFAFGVLVGVLFKKMLPAMAVTLVAFVTARLAETVWIRAHLASAIRQVFPLSANDVGFGSTNGSSFNIEPGGPNINNAWVISTQIQNHAGQNLPARTVARLCPNLAPPGLVSTPGPRRGIRVEAPPAFIQALQHCVAKLGTSYHEVVTYQPSRHYWPLQGAETALFLVAAAALTSLSFFWVRTRLS